MGLRPAGCACRPRHDAAAGSRDPGSFSARLAQSTRARQELQYPNRVLEFLFYLPYKRDARVDSNSNSDDRCQRQKQGGAVGAAASRMRVPPKARCSRWEPRPGLLFCAARAIHPRPLKTSAYASTLRFLFSPAFPSPAKNTCISGTSCYDTNQKKSYKVIRRY